jgi:iron complex outermembrane receptor protein
MLISRPAIAAEGEAPSGPIEEITVTAERRESTVQETPIALTAISSETIEEQRLYTIDRLQFAVPSLTFGMQSSYTLVAIRGIGTDVTTVSEPSVATYEDGVYTGSLFQQNVPGYDLERIEVLRGPQGTLYGRNADGGVINYVSKPPSFDPEANLSVSYGDYDATQVDAGGSMALIPDLVAGRIGVRYATRDPYRDNRVNGVEDFDELDQTAVRGALLIEPSEDFSITLRAGYGSNKTTQAYQLISSAPVPLVTEDTGEPIASADPFGLTNLTGGPYGPLPLGIFSAPAQFFLDNPGLLSPSDITALNGGSIAQLYGLSSQPGPVPPDPTDTLNAVSAYPSEWEVKSHNGSMTVEWDVGPTTLRSITAYRYGKMLFQQDSTGAGTPAVVFDPGEHLSKQFTQEFNFFGTTLDDKLDWIVGTYFYHEDAMFDSTVWLPTNGDQTLAAIATANPAFVPGAPGSFPLRLIPPAFFPHTLFQAPLGAGDELKTLLRPGRNFAPGVGKVAKGDIPQQAFLGFIIDQKSTSAAAFAQLTYHVTDALRVTGGIRYTNDDKEAQRTLHSNLIGTFIQFGAIPLINPDGSAVLCDNQHLNQSWNAWTGTLGVDYDVNESTLTYAKYSRGYKAGAYNPGECGEPYDPEYLRAYEVGLKTTFWDAQIRTNVAVYFYNYDDIQFTLYVPNQSFIRNAGQAEAWGAELEFLLAPEFLPGLQIDGGVSYEDSEYTEGRFRDPAGIVANGIDIEGNPLIRAPEWKFNAGLQYEFAAGGLGNFVLRVEEAYTDEYANDIFNGTAPLAEEATQPSYWIGNARVIWLPNETYEVQAFVENFGDELYAVNRVVFNTPSALENVGGQFTAPRTYGVRVTAHFGQ